MYSWKKAQKWHVRQATALLQHTHLLRKSLYLLGSIRCSSYNNRDADLLESGWNLGIWVFVCDYRSLSSIVLVFPNCVEKPKLNEMNVGHTSDRWFGKEASCVFKQCLTTYLSPVQEWREVCKCCASTDDRNTHKSWHKHTTFRFWDLFWGTHGTVSEKKYSSVTISECFTQLKCEMIILTSHYMLFFPHPQAYYTPHICLNHTTLNRFTIYVWCDVMYIHKQCNLPFRYEILKQVAYIGSSNMFLVYWSAQAVLLKEDGLVN